MMMAGSVGAMWSHVHPQRALLSGQWLRLSGEGGYSAEEDGLYAWKGFEWQRAP